MSLNYSFTGKKILITGGGRGIGRQLVQSFHDGGATVFTVDKNPETITKLREELPNVTAEILDLTDWEETKKVIESFGPIDHLVNNAGIVQIQKFMDITKESAGLHFDVNVGAAINVTQIVAKGLIKLGQEGSVVNISSIAARIGSPIGAVMYSATKAALENLTKSMAMELGPQKIRVNCILPAAVDAPMLYESGAASNPTVQKRIMERMIIKRMINPNDLVDLVMFLLSPLSTMIIGESVVIDGGMLTN